MIPKASPMNQFKVFGHYYSVQLSGACTLECRSVLEIISPNTEPTDIAMLSSQVPNAIFIMMNPGSSKPLAGTEKVITTDLMDQLEVSLVPAEPDVTQYQVMQVMSQCNWSHVRVLNLSDIRQAVSMKFISQCRTLKTQSGFTAHSIFSAERAIELSRKLCLAEKKAVPMVFAWGVNKGLDPLIEECLKKVPQSACFGLLKSKTHNKYFHPLPRLKSSRVKWVNDMVAQIKA